MSCTTLIERQKTVVITRPGCAERALIRPVSARTTLVSSAPRPATLVTRGVRGLPGFDVELQKTATHVQWRLNKDGAPWQDLVPLSELVGPTPIKAGGILFSVASPGPDWVLCDGSLYTGGGPLADALAGNGGYLPDFTGAQVPAYISKSVGATVGWVTTTDARLTDAREWTAATVDQAEAEAGTATTRRAWTAQRVRQSAIAAGVAEVTNRKAADDALLRYLVLASAPTPAAIAALIAGGYSIARLLDAGVTYAQLAATPEALQPTVMYLLTDKYASAPASWYINDLSTMYQDMAMTIPAALEQPVALQLDMSGRGWHRSQATAAKRPRPSRRYNRITASDSIAAWLRTTGATTAAGAVVGPDGVTMVDTLSYDGTGTAGSYRLFATAGIGTIPATGAGSTARVWLRAVSGATTVRIHGNGAAGGYLVCDLTPAWQQFTISGVGNGASTVQLLIYSAVSDNSAFTIGVAQPEIVWTADASLPYQRVTSASDYDADPSKFPLYLNLDGVDDAMVTATQTGWNTTSAASVFAALQRFDNAASGVVAELGADSSAGNGWSLTAPPTAAANTLQMLANGGTVASATAVTAAAYKGIVSGRANMATPKAQAWLGNTAGALVSTTQGAGPYANNPVNWFARNQAGAYFKGRAYGEIAIGADLTDDEMLVIRKYLAMRQGSTL